MKKQHIIQKLRGEHGNTLVEMAAVLPIFFALLIGIIQCSLFLYNYCNAVYAVRVACRYASLHSASSVNPVTTAEIDSIVYSNLHFAGSSTPAVILAYGNRSGTQNGGNYVGDLVGVGVVWANPGILGTSTFYPSAQSYRIISR